MKKSFLLFIFSILIGATPLLAQSRFVYGLKASFSINGFQESDPLESNLKTNTVLPGPSIALGMSHTYFLNAKKTIGLGVGMLYEHSAFTKLKVRALNEGELKRKEQYRKQYVLLPVDFQYHYKKINFSIGIIYTSLISINLKSKSCFTESNRCDFRETDQIKYNLNESVNPLDLPVLFRDNTFIDERNNLQYSLGMFYQLNENYQIGIQYRDFIFSNFLYNTQVGFDYIDNRKYVHQTNSIDFSIRYLIQ